MVLGPVPANNEICKSEIMSLCEYLCIVSNSNNLSKWKVNTHYSGEKKEIQLMKNVAQPRVNELTVPFSIASISRL